MTPTEARAYNRANQDAINLIEEVSTKHKGTQTGALLDDLMARLYSMQLKTAYKVTEISPYHHKQEAVEID